MKTARLHSKESMPLIDAFLIDFVTVDFESDSKIAKEYYTSFRRIAIMTTMIIAISF